MAEVLDAISGIGAARKAVRNFAKQTRYWRRLSDRLFDISEAMDDTELTLREWQRKYDIQPRRPILYMQVIFGKRGCEKVQASTRSIGNTARDIKSDINRLVGLALQALSIRVSADQAVDEDLVTDCMQRIQQRTSWSLRFQYSVLRKIDELEGHFNFLQIKLTSLERLSDWYLAKEHPDIFSELRRRLPGRRVVLKVGDSRMDSIQTKLLDALAARKDADLLHRASGESNKVHIGLAVPQIHKRDFAFLLNMHGRTHEVLVHPVKIKAINDPNRIQTDFPTAVPALLNNAHAKCYMLPSSSTSAGFQVSLPPANLLSELEFKESLSTIIRNQNTRLGSQILYPPDQAAIASGIAQGSFRLIGSQWLQFMDCTNIRWRRTTDGKWTCMLSAVPGSSATSRTLEECLTVNKQRRDRRDLSKHIHIFRIGLVLAEIALKAPISYVQYDQASNMTKMFVGNGEEISANDIAAEVEQRTNLYLGNIVFSCLNALQDQDAMSDRSIEGMYLKDVMKQAEELDELGRTMRIRPANPIVSAATSPRIGGSRFA